MSVPQVDMIKHIKATQPQIQVIAGNVATYDATRALIDAGAVKALLNGSSLLAVGITGVAHCGSPAIFLIRVIGIRAVVAAVRNAVVITVRAWCRRLVVG